MIQSLMTGVTGLMNHQRKLDVVGNNIANVNTIGYKASRITFGESLYNLMRVGSGPRDESGGINPLQIGLGINTSSVDRNFSQGAIQQTGFQTDLALQGTGFFIVRDGDSTYYTRAGNFTVDESGQFVNSVGAVVQGRMADSNGEISSHTSLSDIELPLRMKIPPKATTSVRFYSNLNASATEADATLYEAGTSNVTVVQGTATDGIGGRHTVDISGANASSSTNTGTATVALDITTQLSTAGVTNTDDFTVTLDPGTDREETYTIVGLSPSSTVGELINQLNNQVRGATFSLSGNQIVMSRDYAGDGAEYNVTISDSGTSDVVSNLFNNGVGGSFVANNGTTSTLVAVDTFVDSAGNTTNDTLDLITDDVTGLVIGISGLGDGGITISAPDGLDAATGANALVIDTEDTSHQTTILVYDSIGNTHSLSMEFTKTANDNEWTWEASVSEPAVIAGGNTGTITFGEDGTLESFVFDGTATSFEFIPGNGAERVNVTFDPGDVNSFNGITQTNSAFTTAAVEQDGYAMGVLENILIDQNGRIIGNFTNGVNQTLAEIMVGDFNNPQGLESVGNNMFQATEASGDAIYGLAEDAFGSEIQAGYLEMSNVDLVNEFTDMISAQRGFQANARVITVSDQILAEATNLKR